MRRFLMTAAAVTAVSTVAFAESAPSSPQQIPPKSPRDPNEIVCERQQELGSRIVSQRVCKTRAEWAEQRRTARSNVEQAQTQLDLTHPQ